MRISRVLPFAAVLAITSGSPAVGQAQRSEMQLPDTPAGTLLRAWLTAFNSGDSVRIDEYHSRYEPGPVISGALTLRSRTGGLDLVTVDRAESRHIEVTIKERSGPRVALVVLTTPFDGSMKVATRRILWLGPTPADAARIDAETRRRVVDAALARMEQSYVFPDVAKRAGDSLRARLSRGAYDPYSTGVGFAARLHDELREITRDKHLTVQYTFSIPGGAPPAPGGQPTAQPAPQPAADPCGFVKTEIMPGNIGYLKFNGFAPVNMCGTTASAAMNALAGASALIVDLRENTGGSPEMVSYISSYLFSKRTHLNSLWNRISGQTIDFWTRDDVPGAKFGGEKPVYVLTASRTFSGAEEFSYNLKTRKRAVIIGETTGGGAHPVAGHQLGDNFMIAVPFARAINPITKTNWEGVGVEPDVKVPAADALATALKLIAEKPKS